MARKTRPRRKPGSGRTGRAGRTIRSDRSDRAYRADLAYIHDAGFGGFARSAAPELLKILRKEKVRKGLVVDLGCGSGIWARALADAGYDVVGIDLSAAMVRLSQRRVPEGRFRIDSYLESELPECGAVTSIGECFNYLFDEGNGIKPLARMFRRVHEALRPGGMFIFDVAEPGRGEGPARKCWEQGGWAMFVDVEEDARRRRLTRRITTFRRTGRLYRRDHEVHELRLYEGAQVARELRRAGFKVRTVRGYGKHRFPDAYMGFLARKP